MVHNFEIVTVFVTGFASAYSLSNLYIYCYCGISSTDSYASYADRLYESNWMALPIDLQRPFALMIVHGQKKLSYHGCNIVDLNLELFTKVSIDPRP